MPPLPPTKDFYKILNPPSWREGACHASGTHSVCVCTVHLNKKLIADAFCKAINKSIKKRGRDFYKKKTKKKQEQTKNKNMNTKMEHKKSSIV